jgi:hypothetical protein
VSQKAPKERRTAPLEGWILVPRDRVELPTRGFSVHCSTD